MNEKIDNIQLINIQKLFHEIKTPLNIIIGFSELIYATDNIHEKNNYINLIRTNSAQLLDLINHHNHQIQSNLLNTKEAFDISLLFRELRTSFKLLTPEKTEIILDLEFENHIIVSDKNKLFQILTNFISNAIKFSNGGKIIVGYKIINNGIRLFTEDSGIGIAKEFRTKIFQEYIRLHPEIEGLGLGLSICKSIIEDLKGEIGVESNYPAGSIFWAFIPLEKSK